MLERNGCGGLVTAQACLTLNVAAAGMVGSAMEINERFSHSTKMPGQDTRTIEEGADADGGGGSRREPLYLQTAA